MTVSKEKSINSMNDVIEMTADLMTEAYNDASMTVTEKMKTFTMGQRAIIGTRAEQRKTAMDLARMGQKVGDHPAALTFEGKREE